MGFPYLPDGSRYPDPPEATRTGRENACILYCTACDWELDGGSSACANVCGKCGKRDLRYVRYERGVEDTLARSVIEEHRK